MLQIFTLQGGEKRIIRENKSIVSTAVILVIAEEHNTRVLL